MATRKKEYESGNRAVFLLLGILLLAAGALALLSVIGKTNSSLFLSIRQICFGSAGSLSLGIGIIFIWLGLISAFSAGRSVSKREFGLCFLIYLCVLAIINLMSRVQLLTFPDYIATANKSKQLLDPESYGSMLLGAYRECAKIRQGGGLLGMLVAYPAWKIGGVTFGTVLVGLLTIVLTVMLLRIDVRGMADKLQHKSELRSQERARRRREQEHRERIQEQERKRIENQNRLQTPAFQRRAQPVYPNQPLDQPDYPAQTPYQEPEMQESPYTQAAYFSENGLNDTNTAQQLPQWLQNRDINLPPMYDEVLSSEPSSFLQKMGSILHFSQKPVSQNETVQPNPYEQQMEIYRQRIRGSEAAARDLNINVPHPVDEEFPAVRHQAAAVGSNPYALEHRPGTARNPYARPEDSVLQEEIPGNPYQRPMKEREPDKENLETSASFREMTEAETSPSKTATDTHNLWNQPSLSSSGESEKSTENVSFVLPNEDAVKQEQNEAPLQATSISANTTPSAFAEQGTALNSQPVQPAQTNRINIYATPVPKQENAPVQTAQPAQSVQPNRINIFAKPAQNQEFTSAQSAGTTGIVQQASPKRINIFARPEQIKTETVSRQSGSDPSEKPSVTPKTVRESETEELISQGGMQEGVAPFPTASPKQANNPFVRKPVVSTASRQEKTSRPPEPNSRPYTPPQNNLLNAGFTIEKVSTEAEDRAKAEQLEKTLQSFGIPARVERVTHGPAVTRFELGLTASGINVKRIQNLDGNIAMDMASNGGVRIEIPIPGTNLFGIEVPHQEVESVTLSEVLFSEEMKKAKSPLTVAIGKDISGKPVLCDLAKMPHLLIAGQTGSGKSVCINTIINSLIYRVSPEDVRFIMIDPKVVELQCYNGIPHLLAPVVSDPHKAAGILTWVVGEMLDRYHKMTTKGVREISAYNAKLEPDESKIPRIVVIIDELSDLMMACRKDIEDKIIRIAQLSRAAGIHMVLATQRPTVDVITGLIKANVPSRIAFSVASATDSRTILDQNGAEKLLGRGDMFYYPTGAKGPVRVQGCFLSDGEIERIVNDVKSHGECDYDPDVMEAGENAADKTDGSGASPFDAADIEGVDPRLPEAIQLVMESNLASISMLQRRMKIGHPRAGSLMDAMAERGIVSQDTGSKPREILITKEEYERIKDSLL